MEVNFMKRIISKVICAYMFLAFAIPSVNAEVELITDSEKIYYLASAFIEQNHPGDAIVWINNEEEGKVIVSYRAIAVGESAFNDDDLQKFLCENNVDFTKIGICHMCSGSLIGIISGDTDLNGIIDVTDITELSLALVGDKELTAAQRDAADIDGDGAVTLADLAKLRQYLSKKIYSLG
jgi:hypothetical protein